MGGTADAADAYGGPVPIDSHDWELDAQAQA
jgi:hypothetical protein